MMTFSNSALYFVVVLLKIL